MQAVVTENQTIIEVPDGAELIDNVFYVWKTRFGLFSTMTKEGRKMLTGGTKDAAVTMTRWHLKSEQDGTLEQQSHVIGDAYVGGKL
jgi:hypothetical protein